MIYVYLKTDPKESSTRILFQVQIVTPIVFCHHFRLEFPILGQVVRIGWTCFLVGYTIGRNTTKIIGMLMIAPYGNM
jgi:hypothetical protein